MYVQRGHNFAVVDEVDSILIDEARTPLIISGPAEESTDKYYRIDQIIPKLKPGARITGDKKAEERAELEKTGDYIVDEKNKTVTLTEMGMAHCERLLGVKNLWDPSNMDVLHHVNQGLRAHTPLPPRRRLRGEGRAGHDRRRVHRAPHARPALVGRPAPGGRGQGEGQDRAREPDPRHDHLPELLPHVREALGHDRHRRDRGPRVRQDLQARGAGHPDQPAPHPGREPRRRLPDGAREVRRGREGDRGPARVGPAGPGGHDLDREVRAPLDPAEEGRDQARGPEREVPRARGRDRGPGRPLRRGHDRHQHGRPRHRHHPRRRARPPRQGGARRRSSSRSSTPSTRPPEDQQAAAWTRCAAEMAGEFKRELQQRKPTPRERSELARRYLGPHGLLRPRPPVGAGGARARPRGLAARRRTSTPRATSPARPRRRSPSRSTRRSRTRSTSWPSTR